MADNTCSFDKFSWSSEFVAASSAVGATAGCISGLLVLAGASGCAGELVVVAGTCAAGVVAAAAASLGCVASDDALVG